MRFAHDNIDINEWLERKNKEGWFIKEVLNQELSLTGKYQFLFLMENEIEVEIENDDIDEDLESKGMVKKYILTDDGIITQYVKKESEDE